MHSVNSNLQFKIKFKVTFVKITFCYFCHFKPSLAVFERQPMIIQ